MSVSRNWKAIDISGFAGYEIIVVGEANVGLTTVMPELEKRVPQGTNPAILQLVLRNAGDATPEKFLPVMYNEKTSRQGQYELVEIFHDSDVIERIEVIVAQPKKASVS